MPKSQYVDPGKVFERGFAEFTPIPLCQYNKTLKEEKAIYTKEDFLRIYRDMRIIREFETMLNEIKVKSVYNGVEYHNPGPAHLSIGQEASAVGQAYCLDINDFTFGSHRSHGEILAKGLSSIEKLDDGELYDIMKEFLDGVTLRAVEGSEDKKGDVKDLAINFLLYGALAEIFARTTGFNRGLGGSMHAFFIPFGILPNNAIVGGAAPVALGAALYKRSCHKKGIVIANSGDGALGRGPVHGIDELRIDGADQKALGHGRQVRRFRHADPLQRIQQLLRNGRSDSGRNDGFGIPARLGAGFNTEQMHAERVNGYDPLAVIDATERKKKILVDGDGPALLEVMTYRVSGHSPSDSSTYRTQEEIDAWKEACPIAAYRAKMVKGKIASEAEFDAIDEEIVKRMTRICRMATDDSISPRMDLSKEPDIISSIMFSNQHVRSMDESREPEVLMPKEENPRLKQLAAKSRFAFDENGKEIPKIKVLGLRDALFESILDKFYEDPTLIAYGEDNRDWGGAFARLPRTYRGSAVSPLLQRAHFRIRDRRLVRRICRRGRTCDRRAYVRRLHRLRGRRDIQSAFQVAGDVRRHT